MSPSPIDDDAVRRLAAEILGREEYAGARHAMRALEGLTDWLRWLADALGWAELIDTNPLLYYAILFALLLTSAALITHLVWSIRVALSRHAPARRGSSPTPPRRFADEAEELAGAGQFLEAARRLQLGVIDVLLRGRRLELSRSDANRVLRQRVAEARLPEDDRRDLVQLLDRFETRWFRDREEDADLYRGWHTLYRRLARSGASA